MSIEAFNIFWANFSLTVRHFISSYSKSRESFLEKIEMQFIFHSSNKVTCKTYHYDTSASMRTRFLKDYLWWTMCDTNMRCPLQREGVHRPLTSIFLGFTFVPPNTSGLETVQCSGEPFSHHKSTLGWIQRSIPAVRRMFSVMTREWTFFFLKNLYSFFHLTQADHPAQSGQYIDIEIFLIDTGFQTHWEPDRKTEIWKPGKWGQCRWSGARWSDHKIRLSLGAYSYTYLWHLC